MHKNGNNANIGIRGFISEKQNNSVTKCCPSEYWTTGPLIQSVQHAPLYTNLAFACKTETLNSLYSHALFILTKSSKAKHQVVHEQKFKGLPSSTCQVSVVRIVLDLESEVMRGLGSIPTGGNIFHWIFLFSDANIGIFANFV